MILQLIAGSPAAVVLSSLVIGVSVGSLLLRFLVWVGAFD